MSGKRLRNAIGSRRLPAVEGHGSWLVTGMSVLMTLVAAHALSPLLDERHWWWLGAFVVAVVFVVPAMLRPTRLPRVFVALASPVTLVMTATLIFAPGSTFYLLPTLETVESFKHLAAAGFESISRQSVPASVEPGILFLVVASLGVVAVLMDFIVFTLGFPAAAGILVIPILAVPGLVQNTRVEVLSFVLTGLSYILLLRADMMRRPIQRRDRRSHVVRPRARGAWPATTGIAAISIVGALVTAAVLPGYDRGPLAPPAGAVSIFSGAINPVISLGNDLRRPKSTQALTYTSSSGQPTYLGVVTLDRFTGDNWSPTLRDIDTSHRVESMGPVPGLSNSVKVELTQTHVQITNVTSRWLPLPYPTTSIEINGHDWFWDATDLSVQGRQTTSAGLSYTAESLTLLPTVEQLENAPPPDGMGAYTDLPGNLPKIITDTAHEVTKGAASQYEQAVDLQKYLRSSPFTYSTDAPVENGYDGDGMGVIAKFLTAKSGYCIHFSSAMAVMARTLGIPARLAVGYQPGTPVSGTGGTNTVFEVSSSDLHSWPELYFEGVGWIPFEPTPSRGDPADYTLPAALITPDVPEQPSAAPSAGSSAAPSAGPQHRPLDPLNNEVQAGPEEATAAQPALLVMPSIAALIILLLPAAVRRLQRAVRLRGSQRQGHTNAVWREITATCRDLGIVLDHAQTPRQIAARLSSMPGVSMEDGAAIDRLCAAIEAERFADPQREQEARALSSDARRVVGRLISAVSPMVRVRAFLLPRSLISQHPPPRVSSTVI